MSVRTFTHSPTRCGHQWFARSVSEGKRNRYGSRHSLRKSEREHVGVFGLALESMHELRLVAIFADGFVGDPDLVRRVTGWILSCYQHDGVERSRRSQIGFDPS